MNIREAEKKFKVMDFEKFAYERHDEFVNQKYAETLPYSFHLKAVRAQVIRFGHLLSPDELWTALFVAAGHDLIEDTRMTYNDVVNALNMVTVEEAIKIADIIFALTEEKGKNRSERHSEYYYQQIRKSDIAIFVKLCDIMANVLFSLMTNSSMLYVYQREFSEVSRLLFKERFAQLFEELKMLLTKTEKDEFSDRPLR